MMESKKFRWIAFGICIVLATIAIIVGTLSGFLCFLVSTLLLFPLNRLPDKLDSEIDPKYRKRATAITVIIFTACGLLAFTTAGNGSDKQTEQKLTTTTEITTTMQTTEQTTTTNETTTNIITTTSSTTILTESTTAEIITTTVPVVETTAEAVVTEQQEVVVPETEPPIETEAAQEVNDTIVYITPTGSKYHRIPNCGNGTYHESTLSDAEKMGLSPCKKCW